MSNVLDLNEQDQIVDPQTGLPSHNFLRYLLDRGGFFSEAEASIASLTARQIIAGTGLTGGGALGAGDVTLNADEQAILDEISTTRGAILYRGASGWAALAPGTSGHFLKSNGAGADPSYAAASGGSGGGWSLIHTWDFSIDGAVSAFTVSASELGTWSEVLVVGRAGTSASSDIRVQLSDDDGSTFFTSTSDYNRISNNSAAGIVTGKQ